MKIKVRKQKYKDFLYEWLDYKKAFIKESTYANYSNIINYYIIPLLGNYYLNSINNEMIQKHIINLYNNGNGLSIKTIKDVITIIKSSMKKAFCENKVKTFEFNLCFPKENLVKKIYILTKKEQKLIINKVFNNINNKSIGILISLFHGIRIGELCALTWKDIDLKKRYNKNKQNSSKNIYKK